MEAKVKNLKITGQNSRSVRIAAKYPCASNGTRRPCSYHCEKCFYEIVYCSG